MPTESLVPSQIASDSSLVESIAAPSVPATAPSSSAVEEERDESSLDESHHDAPPPLPSDDIDAHDNDDEDAGENEDEDEDAAALAAAIALSMAVAAEDEARDAAASASPTPVVETSSKTIEAKENETKENEVDASTASSSTTRDEATTSDAPSLPQPVSTPTPLTSPLVTETWFDAFCRVADLLDCFCQSRPLPIGAATFAVDLQWSSTNEKPSVHADQARLIKEEHSNFTPDVDAELMAFANVIEQKHNIRLLAKIRETNFLKELASQMKKANGLKAPFALLASEQYEVSSSSSSSTSAPAIDGINALVRRMALLLYFNYLLQGSLPLIDLSLAASSSSDSASSSVPGGLHSIGQHLSFFRSLLLQSTKLDWFHSVLDVTTLDGESDSKKYRVKVTVDRLLAASHPTSTTHSIFHQAYTQLGHVNRAFLLPAKPVGNPHVAFETIFKGEHAVGESGPYREIMNEIVRELQQLPESATDADDKSDSRPLHILVPSVNQRVATGGGRDRFILNPSANSDRDLAHFTFLGTLIGMAIRTGILLPLAFPRLIWQQLLEIQPTRQELEEIDATFVNGVLIPIEKDEYNIDADTSGANDLDQRFSQHFGDMLTWTTTLSDGSSIELRPNGAQQTVQFAERHEYARLAEWTRMNENREQINALKVGLYQIIPSSVLTLFTADEFERLVCGVPYIDIGLLRRHTEYSGLAPNDEIVEWFFQCLEELTQEERRAFLVFSWAQQVRKNPKRKEAEIQGNDKFKA